MFHSVGPAKGSTGKCGDSELQGLEVFSGWGLVFFPFFLAQFLGILIALANTHKISFGLFPPVFAS